MSTRVTLSRLLNVEYEYLCTQQYFPRANQWKMRGAGAILGVMNDPPFALFLFLLSYTAVVVVVSLFIVVAFIHHYSDNAYHSSSLQ